MSPLASVSVWLARSIAPARGPARIDSRLDRARGLALSFGLALVLGLWCGSARADASVIVELKRADGSSAEGVVRLSKGDVKHECTTKNGRCQIAAVPGGTYNVEVVQADKPAGKPKRVMIPPAGEVKLIVAAQ